MDMVCLAVSRSQHMLVKFDFTLGLGFGFIVKIPTPIFCPDSDSCVQGHFESFERLIVAEYGL